MEMFNNYDSDTFSYVQDFSSTEVTKPESSSENRSYCSKANFSDNEVILASNNPKKRAGRKKFRETRHPVYRGVRLRNSGKWVCEVREPNKKSRIWLGTHLTAEMAARAHDVAAIALRGRSACLNFADSAWRLPVPASTDTKDIQKAAAEAAELFRPQLSESVTTATVGDMLHENGYYVDEEDLFGMHDNNNNNNNNKGETATNDTVDISYENGYYVNEESWFGMQDNKGETATTPGVDMLHENGYYHHVDEEDLFGMHGLLANMAEGMMLPRPQYKDDAGMDADVSLWSF